MPPAGAATPGGGGDEEDALGKGAKYYKVRGGTVAGVGGATTT